MKKIQNKKTLILIGIIILSLTLRTPITGVGAILPTIKEVFNINNTIAGLLTTMPLISFAIFSQLVPNISSKLGLEKTIFYSSIIVCMGLFLRFYINSFILFISTFIIGIGITFGNVLIPSIAKKYFPEKIGMITGSFAMLMTISASVAAGLSYPISKINLGNKNLSLGLSLNIWVLISIVAVIVYFLINKSTTKENLKIIVAEEKTSKYLKKLKMITLILSMGLQSALFYCSVSWFAEIMISKGFSNETAGLILSISQFAQFPATFFTPILADRIRNKFILPTIIFSCYIVSIIGILLTGNNFNIMIIWIIIFALGGGGSFSYVMFLFSEKTRNDIEAAKVSGLSQAGGYIVAAIFPPLLGYVRDIYNWNVSLYILLIISIILYVSLLQVSSKGKILDN